MQKYSANVSMPLWLARYAVFVVLGNLFLAPATDVTPWQPPKEYDGELTVALADDNKDTSGFASINDFLLADSILSIIQNYYVDPERVTPKELLNLLRDVARDELAFRVEPSRNGFAVHAGSLRYTAVTPATPTVEDVLKVIAAYAKIVDSDTKHNQQHSIKPSETGLQRVLGGILDTLDAHSSLMSPDAYRELRQGTEGSFGGLGVLVGIRDQQLTVIKPLPHSPAVREGVQRFDRILRINGKDTFGLPLDDLVEHMRGDPGTDVSLSLLREGGWAPTNLVLRREVIQVDSVTTHEIASDDRAAQYLHLAIDSFSSRTAFEVLTALKTFRAKHSGSLRGLVLDLRSNPGGLLDQAVQVADLFLKSGIIVITKGRRQEVESAGPGYDEMDFPIVVLMNSDSASASEIVAGALQDHNRALVVGQPSFGKGSVQTIFELPGERALKLTIARYFTPSGRSIQNVGIVPDVWIQPVFKNKNNTNLLGLYRYSSERFLQNHLETQLQTEKEKSDFVSALKGYYLTKPMTDPDRGSDEPTNDQELKLAATILDEVGKVYPGQLPQGGRRASHWLALAMNKIRDRIQAQDMETTNWLHQAFSLDWRRPTTMNDGGPTLRLEGEASEVISYAGATIKIPVEIQATKNDSFRVSVYVRSDSPGFENQEILLGHLESNKTNRYSIPVYLPPSLEPGVIRLKLGLGVDAQPISGRLEAIEVRVIERALTKIQVATQVIGERDELNHDLIAPGEGAKLQVDIVNQGDLAAHGLSVQLINFAGRQLQVDEKAQLIEELQPGEKKSVRIAIRSQPEIVSEALQIGVVVESGDLKSPLKQLISLRSRVLRVQPNLTELYGH